MTFSVTVVARMVDMKNKMETLNDTQFSGSFMDLFCGCGGFTLGMLRAGFRCLAAVDFEPHAVDTLRANLPEVEHVLQRDLTKFTPEELAGMIGTTRVDVIVGGPPCQGFSAARKRDGTNHGARLKEDPRRMLYKDFLRFITFFKPKVFVMENVLGIKSAAGGQYFTRVQAEARLIGYRVHGQVEDAWSLGVPQKRRRQLVIGTRDDFPDYFPSKVSPAQRAIPFTNLGAAICDLPNLSAGGGNNESDYDLLLREKHLQTYKITAKNYLFNVLEIERAGKLFNHVARPHNARDLGDFSKLNEGESSAVAMRDHGVVFDFPYDKNNFKDRFTRQSRSKPCSTIVAHLSKDGLMFIHPTQLRSITPREAARIQSFPDWFCFPEPRTHSFRMIGNAVPPLISEAIGSTINEYLLQSEQVVNLTKVNQGCTPVPNNEAEARNWLMPALGFSPNELRKLSKFKFMKIWAAISYLYPGLHPDGACEKGNIVHEEDPVDFIDESDSRLVTPYYEISGWPVVLVPLAEEAWRRYGHGEFEDNEMYRCDAQQAGFRYRGKVYGNRLESAC